MNITELTPQQLRRAVDQRKNRYSEPRTPQPTRRIVIEWSGIGKEAHDERGGEKKNSGGAAGEMADA